MTNIVSVDDVGMFTGTQRDVLLLTQYVLRRAGAIPMLRRLTFEKLDFAVAPLVISHHNCGTIGRFWQPEEVGCG